MIRVLKATDVVRRDLRSNSKPVLYETASGRWWAKDPAFVRHPLAEHAACGLAHLLAVGPPVALVDPVTADGRTAGSPPPRRDGGPRAASRVPQMIGPPPYMATADIPGALTAGAVHHPLPADFSYHVEAPTLARLMVFWAWVDAVHPQLLISGATVGATDHVCLSAGTYAHHTQTYGPPDLDAPIVWPELCARLEDAWADRTPGARFHSTRLRTIALPGTPLDAWRDYIPEALARVEAITDDDLAGLIDCPEPPRWYGTDQDRERVVAWLAARRDRLGELV